MSNFNQALQTLHNTNSFKYVLHHLNSDGSRNPMRVMEGIRLNTVLREPLSHAGAELHVAHDDNNYIIRMDESTTNPSTCDGWWFDEYNLYNERGFHIEIRNLEDTTEIVVHDTTCSNYCGDPLVLISRFIGQGYMVEPIGEKDHKSGILNLTDEITHEVTERAYELMDFSGNTPLGVVIGYRYNVATNGVAIYEDVEYSE